MDRFATLTFDRQVAAPLETLWRAWVTPGARALWSAPSPEVTVDYLAHATRVGERETSLCKVEGQPVVTVEAGWLELAANARSVNYEVVSAEGATLSAALVTADFRAVEAGSQITLTVQLSSLAEDMADGYRHGFGGGLANLADLASRSMVIHRKIRAPVDRVWAAWVNPETLPQWWGPDGFSCKTRRIDLRSGGEWVFDMIAPDGTVFPNHHRYTRITPEKRLDYTLLWGENGPKHADAWIEFTPVEGGTEVSLGMAMSTVDELHQAKGFGAEALGLQTLGKLARFIGAD
jgi:uncharacterized protein YndB with AHSA1/START domain